MPSHPRPTPAVLLLALSLVGAPVLLAQASAPPAAAAARAPLPALREDVATLVQPTDSARHEALLTLLRARRLPFQVQRFESELPGGRRVSGRNVVVALGAGPREIIVGAHYDALRLADGRLSAGAVDNGAGTVALVRVAEALAGRTLRHRVRVVFFDKEEVGLVGSREFARALDPSRVAAMVNLDIAGYGNTVTFGPAARPGNAAVYRAAWRTCAEQGFSCVEFPEYPPSDDRSFQAAGVPNISIAVLPAAEAHQLWLLLNAGPQSGLREGFAPAIARTIHTPDDTVDKLDPAGMTLAYDAVLQLVLRLDAGER